MLATKSKEEWLTEANSEPYNLGLTEDKTVKEIQEAIEAKKAELEANIGLDGTNVKDNGPGMLDPITTLEPIQDEVKEVTYKIACPNADYTGVSASVAFAKGKGETKDSHLAEWFKERGYTVEEA